MIVVLRNRSRTRWKKARLTRALSKAGGARTVAILTIVTSGIPVILQVSEPGRMALVDGFSLGFLSLKLSWCQRLTIALRSFPFEDSPSDDGSNSGEDDQGNGNVDGYPVRPTLVRLLSWGLRCIAGSNPDWCHYRLQRSK